MAELSPAAQAVLDAYGNQIGGTDAIMGSERRGVAAALRAVAKQIGPLEVLPCGYAHSAPAEELYYRFRLNQMNYLLTIAAELAGAND